MSTTPLGRPDWLVEAPYDDVDHGSVKSGKEAQVNLVDASATAAGPASSPASATSPAR